MARVVHLEVRTKGSPRPGEVVVACGYGDGHEYVNGKLVNVRPLRKTRDPKEATCKLCARQLVKREAWGRGYQRIETFDEYEARRARFLAEHSAA